MALGVSDPKERQNNPSLWSEHAIRKPKVLPVLCSHFASSKLNTRPLEQNTEDARTGALSSSHTKHTQGVLNYFSYNGNKRLKEAIAASLLLLKVAALTLHLEDPRDVMLPARAPSAPALLLPLDTNLLLHSSRHNNWKWFLPQPKWKFASSGLQCNEDKKNHFQNIPLITFLKFQGWRCHCCQNEKGSRRAHHRVRTCGGKGALSAGIWGGRMRRQGHWWSKGKMCSRTDIQLLQKWSGREGRKHWIIHVWNQVLKQQECVHRWDLELGLQRRWRKNAAIIFREFNRILETISSLALVS